MIRWEDKSRHTPRGRLADAPPPRSIDQARDDKTRRTLTERQADQDQADRAKS